jgi:hypothetical protein
VKKLQQLCVALPSIYLNKPSMKSPTTIAFFILVLIGNWTDLSAQKKILVDVGHGQKFYSDPQI